ncbi:MAG: TonB family protein [Flavobacteriales bacterium]|nr:TonB family protein [Flavobacteriales bacterium]
MGAIIAIIVLLAISVLLTVDNSWMNVLQQVRNNVVFANHNREYGAFQLRKEYNNRLGLALMFAIGLMVVGIATPFVLSMLGSGEEEVVAKKKIVDVNLELFEEQPEEPPPPPEVIPPPQPKIETVQFVAVEASDEEQDDPPPTQNELDTTRAGTTTEEGADEDVPPPPPPVEEPEYDLASVQEQPEFPGGEAGRVAWLEKNLKYPDMEFEAGISGKIFVEFAVDKDGSIQDVSVKRGVSPGLDKEAVRAVKAMPKWTPGKMGGRPVKVRFVQRIEFKLK